MNLVDANLTVTAGARSAKTLYPAALLSLAIHVYAGAVLFSNWQSPAIEPPWPLNVTLEAAPRIVVQSPLLPVNHVRHKPAAPHQPVPAMVAHHSSMPAVVASERVEPVQPVIAAATERAPAPTVVAHVPAAVSAPVRSQVVELPHFDVAYLNNPRPAYPLQARRLGLEGLVVLRVQVSALGVPEQVALAQTSGTPLLDEAAQKAVQGWKFVPARRGDTPIAHVVDVPVRFQLRN